VDAHRARRDHRPIRVARRRPRSATARRQRSDDRHRRGCSIGAHNAIIALDGITIGAHVYTGPRVYITDVNHGYERLDEPIGHQLQASRPVTIGARSWLGTNSVVLPGTMIGEHVVVAAGSIVSGQVPDQCIVAGAPARIIRRFDGKTWLAVDEPVPRARHDRGSVDLA
jgi:acetyltransferase-like isoleucine patch superfamily enzyme